MARVLHKKPILTFLFLLILAIGYALFSAQEDKALVSFLDIGQGDAALVVLPGNIQILIDGGPSASILNSLENYLPFYDRTIELIVLTHPHADHLRGFSHLAKYYKIKTALVSGAFYENKTYDDFLGQLLKQETEVYIARSGDKVIWNKEVILSIISPGEYLLGSSPDHIHESMVVGNLSMGGLNFLLMGDAEEDLERKLIKEGFIKDVNVLKIGHHGSKTSTSNEFLATSLPEVSVISVGNNSYGHPHPNVVERLKRLGSKILRTDEEGDIVWRFKLQ